MVQFLPLARWGFCCWQAKLFSAAWRGQAGWWLRKMSFNTGILVINLLIFICCAGQVWFVRVGWVCASRWTWWDFCGWDFCGVQALCVLFPSTDTARGCVDQLCQDLFLTTQQSFLLTVTAVGYSRARAFLILFHSPDKLLTKKTPNFGLKCRW